MLNLSISGMKILAQQGVEGEEGGGAGSPGDRVPTLPPEAAVTLVRQREVVAEATND